MKTFINKLLFFSIIISLISCSSSDDNNQEEMEKEPEKGHVSLRINGVGLNDATAELTRESISDLGDGRVRIIARNSDGYRLTFTLPSPVEKVQYGIANYNINDSSVSSVTVVDEGIFLSKAGGRLTISNIVENGDCITYTGSLSIDYRRQNNASGEINVQGTFEMPTEACD